MFGLSSQTWLVIGIGALWTFSAFVNSLPAPTTTSPVWYQILFRFLSFIQGDLGSTFGKYIPPVPTSVKE
jgi:hypothetical protein